MGVIEASVAGPRANDPAVTRVLSDELADRGFFVTSTAQQARPNVIQCSDPVRAQLMTADVVVIRKPLSASSFDSAVPTTSACRCAPGRPAAGSTMRPSIAVWDSVKVTPGLTPIRAPPSSTRRRSRW